MRIESISEFVRNTSVNAPNWIYARWVLKQMMLSPELRVQFAEFINQFPLHAQYQGAWYRVTGIESSGTAIIYLSRDQDRTVGFDVTCFLFEVNDWRKP